MSRRDSDNLSPPTAPFTVEMQPNETEGAAMARTALRPAVSAACTAMEYRVLPRDELDLNALVNELSAQCGAVSRGDLGRPEAMLTAQAHALDGIFNSLAQRAARNIGRHPEAVDTYLRLALRAQSQCRATLETLATIKNPPVVIARQANIAHGPQQVNNGPRARENSIEPNKLLEHSHGERLDFGTTGQTVGGDSAVEAVGAVNRSQDRRR